MGSNFESIFLFQNQNFIDTEYENLIMITNEN